MDRCPISLKPTKARAAGNVSSTGRRRENLTVRQLAQIAGGYGGLSFTGTPKTIADEMEEWLFTGACDGFNVMFPYVPGGLDDFVNMVVPELQRRALFRTSTRGGPCGRTLDCQDPPTGSFLTPEDQDPERGDMTDLSACIGIYPEDADDWQQAAA